ncbi:hypothetical protein [Parvularcula maris]|uniref:Uncharacterized protein n=1 Tax=Parvularcula maris TaxID=2965077 RepID=A0A9X2LDH1_9PROT|nr:hypothetical protein [Parvularcula maris]MCQ8186517.1 hypothetical protein [Parvularcula maris]
MQRNNYAARKGYVDGYQDEINELHAWVVLAQASWAEFQTALGLQELATGDF